jgi:hypothetical protein
MGRLEGRNAFIWRWFFITPLLTGCSDGAPVHVVPVATATIALQIGIADGPSPYTFSQISGIAADDSGRIIVSDLQADEIRVFDSSGRFLFSFGGSGQGRPGEFRRPCCLTLDANGDLWIRDGGNERYVRYRLAENTAAEAESVRMSHSDGLYPASPGFGASGELIDIGYRIAPSGETELQRSFLDSAGALIRTEPIIEPAPTELGTLVVHDGLHRHYVRQRNGPRFLVAFSNRAYATATSHRPEVSLHAAAGVVTMFAPDRSAGPRLTPEEHARAEVRLHQYMSMMKDGSRSDHPAIPEHEELLSALAFDQEGNLQVILPTPPGEPMARALVYDRFGIQVGERHWPREVSLTYPAWIGEAYALGIATDSLGVQRVVKLVFEE